MAYRYRMTNGRAWACSPELERYGIGDAGVCFVLYRLSDVQPVTSL